MTAVFAKAAIRMPVAAFLCAFWLAPGQAAELKPESAVGDIVKDIRDSVHDVETAAARSADPAFWQAATRLQGALANLDLLFEDSLDDEFEDLDEAESILLKDLAVITGKVANGSHPESSVFDDIQKRIRALVTESREQPMSQVLHWSPYALFVAPDEPLMISVRGVDFDKSYYEPVLVVKNQKGEEELLSPKENGAERVTYEVPARFLHPSTRQIERFEAAVEFSVKAGGFLGVMQKDRFWRNPITVLLLPSNFINVAGTSTVRQPKQDQWITSDQVCHTNQGAPAGRAVKYECFTPQAGFAIDLGSTAYVVERQLRSGGGRPSGGCDVAQDAEHAASAERICIACNPIPESEQVSATACAKLRWKEVQTSAASNEVQLDRFFLDGRNPTRLVILPTGNDGSFKMQLTYFTGESVETEGAYRDDWVEVIPRRERNAVEVRMKQRVTFD